VVHCYKTTIPEVQQFPEQLINILQTHGSDLDADMRMVCIFLDYNYDCDALYYRGSKGHLNQEYNTSSS